MRRMLRGGGRGGGGGRGVVVVGKFFLHDNATTPDLLQCHLDFVFSNAVTHSYRIFTMEQNGVGCW